MNEGIRAIHDLARRGYRARAEGDNIRLLYEGYGEPEPATVIPLMALVKEHKWEVYRLSSFEAPGPGARDLFRVRLFSPRPQFSEPDSGLGSLREAEEG